MSDRRALRQQFRRRRRGLDQTLQSAHAAAVAHHFIASPWMLRARTIGLYLASDGELDLGPLLQRLLAIPRKRLALPVVRGRGELEFHRFQATTALVTNRYGIGEPAPGAAFVPGTSIDLLLVPLVAFDSHGTRLGMGAGYYDRFLGRLPRHARPALVGIAHGVQHSPEPLPAAAWDVPLDAALTETGWHRFTE